MKFLIVVTSVTLTSVILTSVVAIHFLTDRIATPTVVWQVRQKSFSSQCRY